MGVMKDLETSVFECFQPQGGVQGEITEMTGAAISVEAALYKVVRCGLRKNGGQFDDTEVPDDKLVRNFRKHVVHALNLAVYYADMNQYHQCSVSSSDCSNWILLPRGFRTFRNEVHDKNIACRSCNDMMLMQEEEEDEDADEMSRIHM